jgi:hypothetical protein
MRETTEDENEQIQVIPESRFDTGYIGVAQLTDFQNRGPFGDHEHKSNDIGRNKEMTRTVEHVRDPNVACQLLG